jgi:hypothetical protein
VIRLEANTHVLRRKSAVRATSDAPVAWPPEAAVREHSGPFLSMAVVCEAITLDDDGAIGIERIVDRIIVDVDAIAADGAFEPVEVELGLAVIIHAGRLRGQFGISMEVVKPGGESETLESGPFRVKVLPGSIDVEFTDEDQMFAFAQVILRRIDRVGTHWFEVRWSEQHGRFGNVLTRVPFAVEAVVRQQS